MILPLDFYLRNDVVQVSRDLLGKVLCSNVEDRLVKAVITEAEAYAGVTDRASHAYGGRRTRRTEPMYAQGSTAYVYLCYGIHHLFNVVVGDADIPLAVLIRAGAPLEGIDIMRHRRKRQDADLLSGPGCFSQALGITTGLTGSSLLDDRIWIEDHGVVVKDGDIIVGSRVGVEYAGRDAKKPLRFRIGAGVLDSDDR
jgi:DNA-3-methyladenine glycosylase